MDLKYQNEIAKFDYDLKEFNEIEMESFRWTFGDINDIRNFEPVYINDPLRERTNYKCFALSFFENKKLGIMRLRELTANRENLFKKLGTHISSGLLIKSDGIGDKPNEITHFNFFTYKNVELKNKFTILESIV